MMADVQRRLANILSKANNKICADCDAKNPRWVSLTLGVLVCIRCCGMHRNLGTHISKMKSVTLDKWKPEWCVVFESLDNSIANAHWERNRPASAKKPTEGSSSGEVERFIRDKYEFKKWAPASEEHPVAAVLSGKAKSQTFKPEVPVSVVQESPIQVTRKMETVDLLSIEELPKHPVLPPQPEEFIWHTAPELTEPSPQSIPIITVPAPKVSSTDANIQAILSMYQQPKPTVSPSYQQAPVFRPLGAIAAEQMMRGGYQAQTYTWPSY